MASIFSSRSSEDNEVAGDLPRPFKQHRDDSVFLDYDHDAGIKLARESKRDGKPNLKSSTRCVRTRSKLPPRQSKLT
jgi:hypothetical protein